MTQKYKRLPRSLMDHWLDRVTKRTSSLTENKMAAIDEVNLIFICYLAEVEAKRARLMRVAGLAAGDFGAAGTNLVNQEAAVVRLNRTIDGIALVTTLGLQLWRLAAPATRLAATMRSASQTKELLRVPNLYYPGIAELEAVTTPAASAAVRDAARELATKASKVIASHLVDEVIGVMNPSFWARVVAGQPEAAFEQMAKQIDRAAKSCERLLTSRLSAIDAEVRETRAQKDELVDYINGIDLNRQPVSRR